MQNMINQKHDDFLNKDAPLEFKNEIKSNVEKLKEINLGKNKDPHPTFINLLLNKDELSTLI